MKSLELATDQRSAVAFTSTLWTAVRAAQGSLSKNNAYHFLPALFVAADLGKLPLPIGALQPITQTVALGGNKVHFTRPETIDELEEAYTAEPRVSIYESIDARSGGWSAIVTSALGRLANCEVTCTVYESSARDQTLGPHRDDWYGAIVQKEGSKEWYLGTDAQNRPRTPTLTLHTGDVLLLPNGVVHDVSTPEYSVHMGFAFLPSQQSHA